MAMMTQEVKKKRHKNVITSLCLSIRDGPFESIHNMGIQ